MLVKQGTYDVEVKMGAAAIAFAAGVSTTVQVTAGPVDPLNTVVSGSGTQAKVTADDTLTLFEEGYLDAVRWLKAGAPSRRDERKRLAAPQGASMLALLREGVRVLMELCGF